jgi:hypothetical protein
MTLFGYELKKLLLTPAIIGFIAMCLILNAVIVVASYNDYEYQSDVEPVNVFEGYNAGEFAEWFIKRYGVTEDNADHIRAKYAKLQPVIDEKAVNSDALSRYLGVSTYYKHGLLFGTVFKAIIAEGCLLALFLALLSVTYENTRNTEQIVFSSRTGRRVLLAKLAASLSATAVTTAAILAFTLLVFFARFDWRGVWGANVSSGFNYTQGLYGIPFMTWHSFTVLGYLLATIGAALLLAVCFCLMGYTVGVLVRNDYGAVIAAITLTAAMAFTEPLFPVGSVIKSVLTLSPVGLWRNCAAWFTDGGVSILWANFESVGLAVSLILLLLAVLISLKTFKRRELL